LLSRGIEETFRGQAWSANCREWVYFDCVLELAAVRKRLALSYFVVDHINDDFRTGRERGFCCSQHHDGIIGGYELEGDAVLIQ
ncbi:MAG: hypothetical protein IAF94_23955, partial [Pirellulaceae bacterium]|nr:hypothetical protein [Pirellulaceae bacterium]